MSKSTLKLKRIVVFCLCVGLLCLLIVHICNLRKGSNSILWECPVGEKIAFIRTGNKPHVLYVLTESKDIWILRKMDGTRVNELASGAGKPQAINPLVVSSDGKQCVVGYTKDVRTKRYCMLNYYNFNTGESWNIGILHNILTYGLMNPFSSDGTQLLLSAERTENKKPQCLWLVDLKKRKARILDAPSISGNGLVFQGFSKNDGLRIYYSRDGILMSGKANKLKTETHQPGERAFISSKDFLYTIIWSKDKSSLYCYNVTNRSSRNIYENSSKNADSADVTGFQEAVYNNHITINILPPLNPLHIDENNNCKEIPLDDTARWRQGCGIAIWDENNIAVVKKNDETSPDRIHLIRYATGTSRS